MSFENIVERVFNGCQICSGLTVDYFINVFVFVFRAVVVSNGFQSSRAWKILVSRHRSDWIADLRDESEIGRDGQRPTESIGDARQIPFTS